jgi:hypothetical protein
VRLIGGLAAVACVACGGEPARLPISLAFDSCAAAAGATTPCDSNVGLWLLDGATGEVLDDACVDFSTGPRPYAELPAALTDRVSFADVTASSIRLELALYSPSRPGCPRPGSASPTLFGQSAVVEPDAAERIELPVRCLGVGSPGDPDDGCTASCEIEQRLCRAELPGDGDREACSESALECTQGCEDGDDCIEACDAEEAACLAQVERCDGAFAACLGGCAGTCDDDP